MTDPTPAARSLAAPTGPRGPALRAVLIGLLLAAFALGGCSSWGKKKDENLSPEALYDRATKLVNLSLIHI